MKYNRDVEVYQSVQKWFGHMGKICEVIFTKIIQNGQFEVDEKRGKAKNMWDKGLGKVLMFEVL